jgi:hypothetical protein
MQPELDAEGREVAQCLSLAREPRHLPSLPDQDLRGAAAIPITGDLNLHGALGLQHSSSQAHDFTS